MRDEVQDATNEKETSQILTWLDPFSISEQDRRDVATGDVTFSDFHLVGAVMAYLLADTVSTIYGNGDLLTTLISTLKF